MKSTQLLGIACVLGASLFTGCQNLVEPSKTTTTFYDNQVTATTKISESVNTVAKAIAPDSPEVNRRVAEIEAANQKLREDMAKARKEADEKNDELKKKVGDVVGDVTKVAAEAAKVAGAFSGVGPLAGTVIELISGVAKEKVGTAKREIVEENATALAKAKETLRAEISQQIKLTEAQQAQFKNELAVVGRERGLSEDEIKKMQSTDLSELLVTGGSAGAIALLALMRTLGRSRAEPKLNELESSQGNQTEKLDKTSVEVDELWEQLKALQAKVAAAEKALDATDYGTLTAGVAGQTATLEDHERRLDTIEAKAG